jgi:hypothetical protein
VFVDDIVIAAIDTLEIAKFKKTMVSRFKLTDLGRLNWYLGTRVTQHANGDYSMDQTKYLEQKLEEYKITGGAATPLVQKLAELLENATDETIPDFPYRSSVGSLMYAMVANWRSQRKCIVKWLCEFGAIS